MHIFVRQLFCVSDDCRFERDAGGQPHCADFGKTLATPSSLARILWISHYSAFEPNRRVVSG